MGLFDVFKSRGVEAVFRRATKAPPERQGFLVGTIATKRGSSVAVAAPREAAQPSNCLGMSRPDPTVPTIGGPRFPAIVSNGGPELFS
jgi:hypothetical protein